MNELRDKMEASCILHSVCVATNWQDKDRNQILCCFNLSLRCVHSYGIFSPTPASSLHYSAEWFCLGDRGNG